jgi:site-specific recombinase XerC
MDKSTAKRVVSQTFKAAFDCDRFSHEATNYLRDLAVRNYTADTIEGRRDALRVFLDWAGERDLVYPDAITKPILESYQRHLWRWRKRNGRPLGISTQRSRLGTVMDFFKQLCKGNHLVANPASELELPRQEKRLPRETKRDSHFVKKISCLNALSCVSFPRHETRALDHQAETGVHKAGHLPLH